MTTDYRRLLDVVNFQGGTQPPKTEFRNEPTTGYVRLIQIRDFTGDKHPVYVPDSHKLRKFTTQDIMIARYGEIKALRGLSGAYNVALAKVIVIDDKLNPDYLYHWFQAGAFAESIKLTGVRAVQSGFNKGDLRHILIPVPPLSEQQRIVDILDRAASVQRLRCAADDKLKEFIPALFVDMFGDPATNPKGWPTVKLGSTVDILSGATPSKDNEHYWKGSVPWVSPKDMKRDYLDDAEDHISENVFSETNQKRIAPRSVLIVIRGMILAHTVPVAMNRNDVAINQDLKALTCKNSLEPDYLLWALRVLQPYFLEKVSTAAHGTKKIDLEVLSDLLLPLPPNFMQRSFAHRVSCLVKARETSSAATKISAEAMKSFMNAVYAI